MAQALELRDETNIMLFAFGNEFFDVLFFARVFPLQLGMGFVFVSVIYLGYDYVSTKACQLVYNFGKLLCLILGCHKHM